VQACRATYRLCIRIKLRWLAPRPRTPPGPIGGGRRRFRTVGFALRASVRAAQAPGTRVECGLGRGSHRPEEQPDPGVGANRQRPVAPTDLGFASAYLFVRSARRRAKRRQLIMPICKYRRHEPHLSEISSKSPLMP